MFMIRCSYKLTGKRTIVTRRMVESLPHKGDLISLNDKPYTVDKVQQEGPTATISVSVQPTNSTSMSSKN